MKRNGILREVVAIPDGAKVISATAKRNLNGEWSIAIEIEIDAPLEDGRRLAATKTLYTRIRQQGRRKCGSRPLTALG